MPKTLLLFRKDLRITDNPALAHACSLGPVFPVYIDDSTAEIPDGAASRWWLHHALTSLDQQLSGTLSILKGDPLELLPNLVETLGITQVVWNQSFLPWQANKDKEITTHLHQLKVTVTSTNSSLLWTPEQVKKSDGTPYKVFTPFYKKGCLQAEEPRQPLDAPKAMHTQKLATSLSIADLQLLPKIRWDKQLAPHWDISEAAAQKQLDRFIKQGLHQYKEGRNHPAQPYVSRLSPYLHHGLISANQVWHAALAAPDSPDKGHFLSELGWREFAYHLLSHFPDLPTQPLQAKFSKFPWQDNAQHLKAWQQGQTGIPIVDAGMRELWETGYMHNRVRMIVGSFLVKNLRLHWRHGADWFWDCLVDADLANNSAGWQWIAGCGADAAPYFRVFNPVTQAAKFDEAGQYIKRFVPELSALPAPYLFSPWEAPPLALAEAGITLGKTYPLPIVDLKQSRVDALEAFALLRQE